MGGALVGGGFGAAAVSVWDKINDTKADIQKVESTVQEAKAGIYKDISDAARGVTQEISGVAKDVAGVGREILNNRFTTERGLCDLGYKTNSDIRDSRDQMGAGFNRVMDRLCHMEHQQSDCCCETKGLIKEVKSDWLFSWNVAAVTSRMANRKSSASSRTLLKTPRLLASIE